MNKDKIVIVNAARTPMGAFQGAFSSLTAANLGASAIKATLERSNTKPEDIDEIIMGCVLQSGQGQAPARQAALQAGLTYATGATTINKMCGSGMKAVMLAHDLLKAGTNKIMLAGGMESMTNAPYLLAKARAGMRMGHNQVFDSMFLDGLEDAYDKGKLMGVFAENTAQKYNFTREQQDDFAIASLKRANDAIKNDLSKNEIVAVSVKDRKSEFVVSQDEQPSKANIDKIPTLKPAFAKDGTVTAANSSSISDGAACLLLMSEATAKARGLDPIAVIHDFATHSQEPAWFTTAPVGAIQKVLDKVNWQQSDVDLFEINEAFAVVTMATMQDLNIPHEKVNIYGGACALGHPIGASGARILITLINALKNNNLKKGVAGLCIGGGEATAMAIELI